MNSLRFVALLSTLLALTACGVEDATIEEGGFEQVETDETALTTNTRFEIFTGRDGRSYFHLIAGNGQKVLGSQGYSSASSAKGGISSVKTNGVNEGRYLLREAVDGTWYFVVAATNGQIVGISQMYSTQAAAKTGINTVIRVVTATANQPLPITSGARFESFRGLDGRYYFHARAANGEIVLQSQGYASSSGANSGISSVKTNGANIARFQVREAADGKHYFVLKASNGAVIGFGETYESKAGAEVGAKNTSETITSLGGR